MTDFLLPLVDQMTRAARSLAARSIPSKRIAASLQVAAEMASNDEAIGKVTVPFYWAIYYHDGRGPVRAKPGHLIVFFKDPDDDPRIDGPSRNYPATRADIRRLSKAEFRRAQDQGLIVATKRVGPAPAHPFFDEGMRGFPAIADSIAKAAISAHVLGELKADGTLRLKL